MSIDAMQRGRAAAQRQREKEGRERVRRWRAWIAAGSPLAKMPAVPTDADYVAMKRWERSRGRS